MAQKQKLIRFDWAMKRLLRKKVNFDILEGFLSELIGEDLHILQLLESETNQIDLLDKQNRVDLLAENQKKELILIEVQNEKEHDYLQRLLYGTSKIISEHLEKGMKYAQVKKVYSVSIVYFDLGQGDDYIYLGRTDFIGKHKGDYLQLNKNQKKMYGEDTKVYQVFPEYFLIKVNNFNDIAKDSLDEWIYFFKNEDIKNEFKAKGIQKARQEFDIMKMPNEEQKAYDRYMESLSYQASIHESTYVLGYLFGKEESEKEFKNQVSELQNQAEVLQIQKDLLKQKMEAEKAEKEALKQQAQTEKEALKQQAQTEKEALKQQAQAEKEALEQKMEAEKEALKQQVKAEKTEAIKNLISLGIDNEQICAILKVDLVAVLEIRKDFFL